MINPGRPFRPAEPYRLKSLPDREVALLAPTRSCRGACHRVLSGGQTLVLRTAHLNAINRIQGSTLWKIHFSYGRALQNPALKDGMAGREPGGRPEERDRKFADSPLERG